VGDVEDVLAEGFGADSAGFESVAAFDSVAGLASPPEAAAPSPAGFSAEPDVIFGA
jgi:hypothetical protein